MALCTPYLASSVLSRWLWRVWPPTSSARHTRHAIGEEIEIAYVVHAPPGLMDTDAAEDNHVHVALNTDLRVVVALRCLKNCAWRPSWHGAQFFTVPTGPTISEILFDSLMKILTCGFTAPDATSALGAEAAINSTCGIAATDATPGWARRRRTTREASPGT